MGNQCLDVAHSGSKSENIIKDYITTLLPDTSIIKESKILNGKEIDIYIPDTKLGIEYNGSPFHASENGVYGDKPKNYHQQKFLMAKEKGINLITIFDKDFEENPEKILQAITDIILNRYKPFIPKNEIEYTDNDFGINDWIKQYGYEEIGQEEPVSFMYQDKFIVYRCGKTKWRKVVI